MVSSSTLVQLAICIEKVRQQDKESEDGIESEESVSAYAEVNHG